MERLAQFMSQKRLKSGLTLGELSEKVGCSIAEIEAFESNIASIAADDFFKMVEVLNIDPAEVLEYLPKRGFGGIDDRAIEEVAMPPTAQRRDRA